jgi:hypothetical protein
MAPRAVTEVYPVGTRLNLDRAITKGLARFWAMLENNAVGEAVYFNLHLSWRAGWDEMLHPGILWRNKEGCGLDGIETKPGKVNISIIALCTIKITRVVAGQS